MKTIKKRMYFEASSSLKCLYNRAWDELNSGCGIDEVHTSSFNSLRQRAKQLQSFFCFCFCFLHDDADAISASFPMANSKKVFTLIMKTVEEAVVKANWFVLCAHQRGRLWFFFVLLMHEKLLKSTALVSYAASVLTSLSPLKHVCQDSHSNKPLIMAVYDTSFHPRPHCKSLLLTVVHFPLITLTLLSSSWVILESVNRSIPAEKLLLCKHMLVIFCALNQVRNVWKKFCNSRWTFTSFIHFWDGYAMFSQIDR